MIILAFDVAITGCAVACFNAKSGEVWARVVETERGQAEVLVPLIGEIVGKGGANLPLPAIDRIAVTRGPGSFTGIRIGLSVARTLGLALDRPVLGFSVLSLLARSALPAARLLVLVDTKRGDYYGQIFDEQAGEMTPPQIWSEQDAEEFDGDVLKAAGTADVRLMARLAAEANLGGEGFADIPPPSPLYLREAEITTPRKTRASFFDRDGL